MYVCVDIHINIYVYVYVYIYCMCTLQTFIHFGSTCAPVASPVHPSATVAGRAAFIAPRHCGFPMSGGKNPPLHVEGHDVYWCFANEIASGVSPMT